jgi:quercetin dioxygenase-like cupin family protein
VPTIRRLPNLDGTPHATVFPGSEPKTVRLALAAGERVPPHRHPDRDVVLFVRRGELELGFGEATHRLEAGDVVRFEGEREVAPRAVTETAALVVLSPRPAD